MNVNIVHWVAVNWPLYTNFLTVLQTRYIVHSSFVPTYLSPLHPSAAASSAGHPTVSLYRGLRDVGFRSLWSHEGLRGMFRGVVPSIASIGVRGFVLSKELMDASDSSAALASNSGRSALQQRVSSSDGDKDEGFSLQIQLYLPFIDPQRVPLATLAAYPLDHIRTLMQLAQHNISAVRAPHSALAPAGSPIDYVLTPTSLSASATVRSLVQQYGVTALYRGVMPALIGQSALVGSGLQLFDEVMQWMRADGDEIDEAVEGADGTESERKIVFPLSLVDRLSNSPPLVSSAVLFLSSYLLVFYPASVVSTHMRAATFSSAHVSTRPLGPPPHPAASHHLHVYAASSPPPSSSSTLPGMMATIRRIGVEQGVRGFYRGFTLHVAKCRTLKHTCPHTTNRHTCYADVV